MIPNPAGLGTGAIFPTNDTTDPNFDLLGNTAENSFEGNYDQSIVVDALNPNVIYVGGTDSVHETGLIRVDTTGIHDPYVLVGQDDSDPDGGLTQVNTTGAVDLGNATQTFGILDTTQSPEPVRGPYLNLLRDPSYPFLSPSSFQLKDVTSYTNDGTDAKWRPADLTIEDGGVADVSFLDDTSNFHRMISFVDPLTGMTRFIFADDGGVYTTVVDSEGNPIANIGATQLASGSRNGNLQILQMYGGASQPSTLAANIAGALFYSASDEDGFAASDPNILSNGNLAWTPPPGTSTATSFSLDSSGFWCRQQRPNRPDRHRSELCLHDAGQRLSTRFGLRAGATRGRHTSQQDYRPVAAWR